MTVGNAILPPGPLAVGERVRSRNFSELGHIPIFFPKRVKTRNLAVLCVPPGPGSVARLVGEATVAKMNEPEPQLVPLVWFPRVARPGPPPERLQELFRPYGQSSLLGNVKERMQRCYGGK